MSDVKERSWIDELITDDRRLLSEDQAVDMVLSHDPPSLMPERELEKTDEEVRAIDSANAALVTMLKTFGREAFIIPPHKIHVFHPSALPKVFTDETTVGGMSFGHVYVKRQSDDTVVFIHALTHEMAHATSFQSYRLMRNDSVDGKKPRHPYALQERRTGLSIKRKNGLELFSGLNEAATEMLSFNIKVRMPPEYDGGRLHSVCLDAYHFLPAYRLCKMVTEPGEDALATYKEILRDYLAGTNKFLRRCSRWRRGIAKILAAWGDSQEDAERTAEALGLG